MLLYKTIALGLLVAVSATAQMVPVRETRPGSIRDHQYARPGIHPDEPAHARIENLCKLVEKQNNKIQLLEKKIKLLEEENKKLMASGAQR